MSRFYASIRGNAKTEATRQGTEDSGITGHIRGWNLGVEVEGRNIPGSRNGDEFLIYVTGGSNAAHKKAYVGIARLNDKGEFDITISSNLFYKQIGL